MKKNILITIYAILSIAFLALIIQIPYIIQYSYGNFAYNQKKYEEAINKYESALKLFPPKSKECRIRINLALAMLKTINNGDNANIKLKTLQKARDVITEKGCANDEDDKGHNKEAEKLKKDIDREIEKLQKQKTDSDEDDNENEKDEKKNDEKNDSKEEKETKEKLKKLEKIQEETLKERKSELDKAKEMFNFEYYSGKKW